MKRKKQQSKLDQAFITLDKICRNVIKGLYNIEVDVKDNLIHLTYTEDGYTNFNTYDDNLDMVRYARVRVTDSKQD